MDEDRKIGGRGELTGRLDRRLKQALDNSRKGRQVEKYHHEEHEGHEVESG